MTLEEGLLKLSLPDLALRLRDLGWVQVGEEATLLRSPTGMVARVPANAPDSIRLAIIRDVFAALAEGDELVSSDDLIAQYLSAVDLLFIGVDLPNVPSGLLPLRSSRAFYERWQSFFTQAAAAEANYNKKGTTKVSATAKDMLDRLYWGKTLSGSYMQAIHIPVDAVLEPFGRKLWRRVILCLDSLHSTTVPELLSSEALGWNAPMCERLAALIEDVGATAVKAEVRPDKTRRDLLGDDTPTSASASIQPQAAVELLMKAAYELREIKEAEEQTVTGFAFELIDPSLLGRPEERSIRIQWQVPEAASMVVYVQLTEAEYGLAIDAHKQKRQISLTGLLTRSGKKHHLTNYRDFRIV